ncbi:hypothetical protein [Montanilutibacter psychrotolerans]|uniref:Uncharacterized protein n=1 Tax=Montanilutibacter psychrotolerans TaxID=1327343 RepID=A0A3M8T1W1_9GAMM|nr:hypothetical protein [Lysobacter psychrotolerans]RNF85100.1 hypothetical protein EER27_04785 [Lysobacter psychrotolerans]
MNIVWTFALTVIALAMAPARAGHAPGTTIQSMPDTLETRLALSAMPPELRDAATVYVLDPANGYGLARQGSSGVACLVQRTVWELGDFRDDIYIPLCYDAVGTKTYLRVIMDAAALRASGTGAVALKAQIAGRFRDGTYAAPAKAGLSYMLAPVMRTVGPPDMQVRTMAMPHLMFYAPGVTNADIGAHPDLAAPGSLRNPFIDRQGIDEQSYMIQLVGDAEKARILADEQALIEDLCAYRDALCLAPMTH